MLRWIFWIYGRGQTPSVGGEGGVLMVVVADGVMPCCWILSLCVGKIGRWVREGKYCMR